MNAMPGESIHVLIVDDDAGSRLLMRRALERAGFAISEAADGAAAVSAIEAGVCNAVLMDVEMPQMNGRQFLAGRASDWLDIPIVILTGSDQLSDLHGTAGVVAILRKPCDLARLLVTIDAVLRARP